MMNETRRVSDSFIIPHSAFITYEKAVQRIAGSAAGRRLRRRRRRGGRRRAGLREPSGALGRARAARRAALHGRRLLLDLPARGLQLRRRDALLPAPGKPDDDNGGAAASTGADERLDEHG